MNQSATTGAAAAHKPYVSPGTTMPEFTWSALLAGSVLGIVFGASSMYLVLKAGLTVSASIPIAVLSITLFRVFAPIFGRNATILENNIVQTTGSSGESIAFGVGVTIPALLILGYDVHYSRVALVAILGAVLGVLMMIPLRRAFIVKQHGKLAFPEGTACADVLIVGEKGGTAAALVFAGFGVGFIYWFLAEGMKFIVTAPVKAFQFFKGATVSCEVAPHLLGVGYVIGTRVSCIMVGGGVLASWVLAPAIVLFGSQLTSPLYPATKLISDMSPREIRDAYVLYIGAGAVATGGIISMLQAMPVILSSIVAGLRDISQQNNAGRAGSTATPRTDRDLSMRVVLFGSLGVVLAIWAAPMLNMNALGAVCIVAFGFLFVTVSSRLVGEIGSSSNPISGMTVATLLMTCSVFLLLGWTGADHKLQALSIAAIVCIAASIAGATSQCLKTGFLLGGTPRYMQIAMLVGALTSAVVIGGTLIVLNNGGTVYTEKNLPTATIPVTGSEPLETVASGPKKGVDTTAYRAVHVRLGEIAGVEPGKYLVDEKGVAKYLVDPAVNGRVAEQDDGTKVTKYEAPKAALMSFIIDGILSQKMPWSLVLLGVAIALVLQLAGVPPLPFAVGVYLPLSVSMPIFVGGMVRWIVERKTGAKGAESEMSPGMLLSSGLIAGGTIAGIVAAIVNIVWTDSAKIGRNTLGALVDNNGFAMIPFGVITVLLILVAMFGGKSKSQGA